MVGLQCAYSNRQLVVKSEFIGSGDTFCERTTIGCHSTVVEHAKIINHLGVSTVI